MDVKFSKDTFTPYSKEFFDKVKLEVPIVVELSPEQAAKIKEGAESCAKKLVEKHWQGCFKEALNNELNSLEDSELNKEVGVPKSDKEAA